MKHFLSLAIFSFILCTFSMSCSKTPEKKFAIIIPSYNNEKYCKWNVESALNQKYSNYKIIYINDCSRDNTLETVTSVVNASNKKYLVTIIDNTHRVGALKNIYDAIHNHLDDDAIVLTLDGDDALANSHVLSYLNKIYSNEKKQVWLTYGQHQEKIGGNIGFCCPMPEEIIKKNAFRKHTHIPSHLRTFYAWLFKKIKTKDLIYNGEFYPMTWDMAMMLPMIEMARDHFLFIPKVLYIYNNDNPISDHRKDKSLQRALDLHIRTLSPYTPLTHSPIRKGNEN